MTPVCCAELQLVAYNDYRLSYTLLSKLVKKYCHNFASSCNLMWWKKWKVCNMINPCHYLKGHGWKCLEAKLMSCQGTSYFLTSTLKYNTVMYPLYAAYINHPTQQLTISTREAGFVYFLISLAYFSGFNYKGISILTFRVIFECQNDMILVWKGND